MPHKARGFVDPHRGEQRLHNVLIPVDHEPNPAAVIAESRFSCMASTGAEGEARLLHIEANAPRVQHPADPRRLLPVDIRKGDPVEAINNFANEWPADLIVMPTGTCRRSRRAARQHYRTRAEAGALPRAGDAGRRAVGSGRGHSGKSPVHLYSLLP